MSASERVPAEQDAVAPAEQDAVAPAEVLVVRGGYAIAWSAPWGAAASIVTRFAPEYARPSLALGRSDRTRRDPPRLFHVATGIAAVWCQDDGAWLAVIDEDGEGFAAEPRRVLEGGRSLAVAAGRRHSHVFVEDGACVRVVEIDARGEPTVIAEPLFVQTGRARIAAARAGDAPLLIAAYAGERRLVVADGSRGRASLSRHDLPGACSALDAYGAGGRAAFAIAYEAGEVVEAGVIDAAGKLVERRHAVLREPGALYSHVRVTWIEEDFHVVARDARHDRASVVELGAAREIFSVPRVVGPFAVAYHGKRFSLAQAFAEGDESVLRITRTTQRGREPSTSEVRQAPPASLRARRAEEQTERWMLELERALGGSGYRDVRVARVSAARGAALRLASDRQQLELCPEGEAFRLTVIALGAEEAEPAARDGSLERLARWVRERLSPEARLRAARDREIGEQLAVAIGGELTCSERSEGAWRCEVRLAALPQPARMTTWLRSARERMADESAGAPAP